MKDDEKIILEAYKLITAFYPEIVKLHEKSYDGKHYELIKQYEKFELKHGIKIENIIKKTMSRIEKRVIEIIASELGYEESTVRPDMKLREDLGADSLDIVQLSINIELEFKFTIPNETQTLGAYKPEYYEKWETVQDVINTVINKLKP